MLTNFPTCNWWCLKINILNNSLSLFLYTLNLAWAKTVSWQLQHPFIIIIILFGSNPYAETWAEKNISLIYGAVQYRLFFYFFIFNHNHFHWRRFLKKVDRFLMSRHKISNSAYLALYFEESDRISYVLWPYLT